MQSAELQCSSAWLIHNYGWEYRGVFAYLEGWGERKTGKSERFNIWIEQRNFFPQGSCREEP